MVRLSILLSLFVKHVFEDVEQVVDSLRVELRVLVLVGVQVILRQRLRLFAFQGESGHVNDGECAHCAIFMPEVQLKEKVGLIARWCRCLVVNFVKVITVQLHFFK